jgi:hypothetical protein
MVCRSSFFSELTLITDTFGYEFGCYNSEYKFDSAFLIMGYYDDDQCKDFNYFFGLRADFCVGIYDYMSYKYTSSSRKYSMWTSNGECKGKPDYSGKYPTGNCLGTSRRLEVTLGDDAPPADPGAGSSASNFGTAISSDGEIKKTSSGGNDEPSVGVIVGAVVGTLFGLCLIFGIGYYFFSKNSKATVAP